MVSTEAVLAEATHLLSRVAGGSAACLDFVLRGGATLVPSSPTSLRRCRSLMEKYSDLPMDFADATLVALAEDLEAGAVLTTDPSDFSVYRWSRRRPFEILPPPLDP